ncbi:recombinase family protein [Marinisporobacter balticus]|uniref:DNA invertase Pin-like site-specific DNA recombinase n=1 Tax=Marinisporobacter balticus TaxID=2018667 RepID=A0A4R2L143_9FIRM|nr:recombinase family protein [Marinisporobacter balticus]TCO79302.1 DNA invertase Pin-like site-specific DNA recombinase [Marinisporobacter balticus]
MNFYGYVRISRDDNGENYETILTQKQMIRGYVKEKFEKEVLKIYEDDNVSGYKFERTGLSMLEEEIKLGKVNVLVVKDLSRIGRNNALTLLYLEFLREKDVRIICISDNYDSFSDDDDIIGIKTWYNERYVKDISRKITENIRIKQKNGGMIIRPYFGYNIDPYDKKKLILDESSTMIVKRIFRLYIEGNGYRKIAEILNKDCVMTPSKYRQIQTGHKCAVAEFWTPVHVQRIITDDVYIGTLRCGKTKKKKVKGDSVRVPKDEHIIYENNHPAIISKEDFELTQTIGKRRNKRKIRSGANGMNLLSGFLFCGDCGKYMVKWKRKNKSDAYVCGAYHTQGKKYCTSHHIKEEDIINIISNELQNLIEYSHINKEKLEQDLEDEKKLVFNYVEVENKFVKSILDKKLEMKHYARQLAKGLIDEEVFNGLTSETNQELKTLKHQLVEIRKMKDSMISSKDEIIKGIDKLKEIVEEGNLGRKQIEILLDRITIYQKEIEGRGCQPKLEVRLKWNDRLITMCLHNQGGVK